MSSSPQVPRLALQVLNAPSDPARRFRLLERVRARLRDGRYSRRTEEAYVAWIRRYVIFHDRRHPSDLGPEHVRQFLSALATEQRVAASTQNQALAALLFLYDRYCGDRWRESMVSRLRVMLGGCRWCSRSGRCADCSTSFAIPLGSVHD